MKLTCNDTDLRSSWDDCPGQKLSCASPQCCVSVSSLITGVQPDMHKSWKGEKMTINQNQSFLPCMNYKQIQKFRQQVYELLNFAQDATFELTDAVLTTRNVYSLADFSLSPFF